MKRIVFITIILFLCISSLLAKVKQERCGGTYAYTYSGSISYDEARTKAIENAIVMALADKFGTTVTLQSLLELTNSGDRFDQMSRLQVKGKLVRHINAPVVSEPVYADNMFTLNVTVDFYATPIEYAPVEFVAKHCATAHPTAMKAASTLPATASLCRSARRKRVIWQRSSRTATRWCASYHISVMTICRFVWARTSVISFSKTTKTAIR